MDSQPNNLYDTASQPDTGHDEAYTFLEFNTQGDEDFDYPEFHEKLWKFKSTPVQNIVAKDVHGKLWKFRHIYRGTRRRHLLTTGWSNFVNQKKLVASDSIVFLRADNGDLCVGIRRAKRGFGRGFLDSNSSGWNASAAGLGNSRKVSAESVVEAVNLAAASRPFGVVFYPRASTPEFCVKASTVKAAMRIQWCPEMRFKMALRFVTDKLVHGHGFFCRCQRSISLAQFALEAPPGSVGRTRFATECETGQPVVS